MFPSRSCKNWVCLVLSSSLSKGAGSKFNPVNEMNYCNNTTTYYLLPTTYYLLPTTYYTVTVVPTWLDSEWPMLTPY